MEGHWPIAWNSRVYIKYQVSSYGHVKNKNTASFIGLNAKKNGGYIVVCLTDDQTGRQHSESVHRLVAKAFLPTPNADQTVVNHKNCVRTDNKSRNFEWTTFRGNVAHALGRQVILRVTSTTGSTHDEESSSASATASVTAAETTTTIFFDSIAAAERECRIFIQQNQRNGQVHNVNVYWEGNWVDGTIQVGNIDAINQLPPA